MAIRTRKDESLIADDLHSVFDPAQIKAIFKVAQTRSFSRAAEALGITQPTVSMQIKRAELAIGRPLFARRKTRVDVTREGEAVIVYARAMMTLNADLRDQLVRLAGSVQVSVGLTDDFSRTALPSVLGLFARAHPRVEMRVVAGTYGPLSEVIEAGKVDLAVLRRNARLPNLRPLWSDRVAWVAARDYLQPVPDPVPLCLPFDSPAKDVVIETLEGGGRRWRLAFESNSLASLEAALQSRLGIGALPVSMVCDGIVPLAQDCGLPDLPDVEFAMHEPSADAAAAVHAFAAVMRSAAEARFKVPEAGFID